MSNFTAEVTAVKEGVSTLRGSATVQNTTYLNMIDGIPGFTVSENTVTASFDVKATKEGISIKSGQTQGVIAKYDSNIGDEFPVEGNGWFDIDYKSKNNVLTRREKEVLQLIAKGRTSLQIARQFKLSRFTIDTHRKNIHNKLGIKTNTGLVKYALKYLDIDS